MNEELKTKLQELESLTRILSESMELVPDTHDESIKKSDVSNILAIINNKVKEIIEELE
ncbi:MAG: hypothetical protein GX675_00320 [Erysipelotrichaceae bacterium]|nr:hypothetical protein [Erysipelotrichaceae bacterium]